MGFRYPSLLPPLLTPGGSSSTPTERADRVWHRVLAVAMLVAVGFHLALFLLFRVAHLPPTSPFGAAGPKAGDYRAAAGGDGGLEAVEVRVAQPQEEVAVREEVVEPVPVPTPAVEPVEVEPAREPSPDPVGSVLGRTAEPGTGGEAGEREGPGTATGDGEGAGGTGDEGRSDLLPPTPRGMILPPADRPRSVRGREVTVWVFVTDRGRVLPDSTRLDPPTPDRKYNQRLMRSAAEWVFQPARRAGRPVGAWYPYQIIL